MLTRWPLTWSGMTLAWVVLAGVAHAADSTVADNVGWGRELIVKKDYVGALVFLQAAEDMAAAEPAPVPARILSSIWYLRAVVELRQGDPKQKAIHYFRQTLVIDNKAPWDTALIPSGESHTLFEALRKEVTDRGDTDVMAPEKTGAAKLFVDGERVRAGDTAIVGRHLAQITCPDGTTHGAWTTFDKKFEWFELCPAGVDPSAVVTEAPTDELGLLPDWDSAPEVTALTVEPATDPQPDAEPADPKPADPKPDDGADDPTIVDAEPLPAEPSGGGLGAGTILLTTGGAFLAAGVLLDVVWVDATYTDVETARANPTAITRDQADELTAAFNTARWTTLGLLGVGVSLSGVSFFVDASGTSGLSLSGQW